MVIVSISMRFQASVRVGVTVRVGLGLCLGSS